MGSKRGLSLLAPIVTTSARAQGARTTSAGTTTHHEASDEMRLTFHPPLFVLNSVERILDAVAVGIRPLAGQSCAAAAPRELPGDLRTGAGRGDGSRRVAVERLAVGVAERARSALEIERGARQLVLHQELRPVRRIVRFPRGETLRGGGRAFSPQQQPAVVGVWEVDPGLHVGNRGRRRAPADAPGLA